MIVLRWMVTAILCLALSAPLVADERGSIEVVVTGAEPEVGAILVSLFDSSVGYLKAPLFEAVGSVDHEGIARVDLGRREPGKYAVVVVYDSNGNGKLDTGLFGIPREKVGYSNNAIGRLGPATWEDTHFVLGGADMSIDIRLAEAGSDDD